MSIRLHHDIDDLARDLRQIQRRSVTDMIGTVREGVRTGGTLARDNAKRTAGKHGKHYPNSITWDRKVGGAFGFYRAEYGPDPAKKQGGMSFEHGSRNQAPHLDLAKSADVIGPAFQGEVRRLPDNWFWV